MSTQTIVEAVRAGLAEEMRRDPTVWALGEDIGVGGIYGQYKGLIDEFGPQRIVSTPISESLIMNAGLGAALAGTRPVIEMRIADFTFCAWDELTNQIAKVRYMFGGQCRAPLVVRMPHGLLRHGAAQHSQSFEAWLVHTPGLVVLAPSNAADAKACLKAAIRCDDPVALFEPKGLWNTAGEVPDGDIVAPIGKAHLARAGTDVTLVSWAMAVPCALAAAESLAAVGISVEVIDLRSLWPWDRDAVLASVRKTRRLVIAHEAVVVGGFGAEVAAVVAESLTGELLAPIVRVGAPRTPVPYSPPLESTFRVTAEKIHSAVTKLVPNAAQAR